MSSEPLFVAGMKGLGDNIYQRSFLLSDREYVVSTPWPQIYADMPNVSCMPTGTNLRTQQKNEAKSAHLYNGQRVRRGISVEYGADQSIYDGMRKCFGNEAGELSLPMYKMPDITEPYAIIRPVSVRSEWRADSRNCLPEYVDQAARVLSENGIRVISVADFQNAKEWPVGDLPYADERYHAGEFDVDSLLALVQNAVCVVGPIGWIVPATMAYKTPAWVICGGQGGYNHPLRITNDRWGENLTTFAHPDVWCMCKKRDHNCPKEISAHEAKFRTWLSGVVPGVRIWSAHSTANAL